MQQCRIDDVIPRKLNATRSHHINRTVSYATMQKDTHITYQQYSIDLHFPYSKGGEFFSVD
ncbi:MAG: hypothetical protein WA667_21240 [Candidatus Nitrosopolaris sp.]